MASKAVTDAASPCAAIVTALHEEGVQRRWQLVAMLKNVWGYDDVEAGATIDAAEKNGLITCIRDGSEVSEEAWIYMLPNSGIGVPVEAEDQAYEYKHDKGKPQMSYLLERPHAAEARCRVSEYGAREYGRGNWPKVEPQRYLDAAMRHLMAMGPDGEGIDADSGLFHRDMANWNIDTYCELKARK